MDDLMDLGNLAHLAEELEEEEDDEDEMRDRVWVRSWVGRRGDNVPLYTEVHWEDREKFFANFRLYPEDFDKLLARYKNDQYIIPLCLDI